MSFSLDDLLVGAPFYYTSSSSGAVYVYTNQGRGFSHDHPYTKLEGERSKELLEGLEGPGSKHMLM